MNYLNEMPFNTLTVSEWAAWIDAESDASNRMINLSKKGLTDDAIEKFSAAAAKTEKVIIRLDLSHNPEVTGRSLKSLYEAIKSNAKFLQPGLSGSSDLRLEYTGASTSIEKKQFKLDLKALNKKIDVVLKYRVYSEGWWDQAAWSGSYYPLHYK